MIKISIFWEILVLLLIQSCNSQIMKKNKVVNTNSLQVESKFNLPDMLQYTGSLFLNDSILNPIQIADLENTDSNEHNISLLLSYESIPYKIERSKGWSSNYLFLLISQQNEKKVREIIMQAVMEGVITLKKDYRIRGKNKE